MASLPPDPRSAEGHWEFLQTYLNPAKDPPSLHRINGVGNKLIGSFNDPLLGPMFFARCYATVFAMPIVPGRIYLVSKSSNTFRFHGSISKSDLRALYGDDGYREFQRQVGKELILHWLTGVLTFTVICGGVWFFSKRN